MIPRLASGLHIHVPALESTYGMSKQNGHPSSDLMIDFDLNEITSCLICWRKASLKIEIELAYLRGTSGTTYKQSTGI